MGWQRGWSWLSLKNYLIIYLCIILIYYVCNLITNYPRVTNNFFYFCFGLNIASNSTNIIMLYSMFVGLIFLCYIYLVIFNVGYFQIISLGLSKKACTLVKVVVFLCRTKGQWNVELHMLEVHVSYISLSTLGLIFIYLLYTFTIADHWSNTNTR